MSDSPKYSSPQLMDGALEILGAAAAQGAAAVGAARATAAAQYRQIKLSRARHKAAQALAAVEAELAQFGQTEAARFARESLSAVRARQHRITADIQSAATPADARQAGNRVDELGRQLQQVIADATAAQLAANLASEAAAVVRIKQQLAGIDQLLSQKFDADGLQGTSKTLQRAVLALERKALEEAVRTASEAAERLKRHCVIVEQRHGQWLAQKDQAETKLAAAMEKLAELQADENVRRWTCDEALQLQQHAAKLEAWIAEERFAEVQVQAAKAVEEASQLIAKSQELRDKENRRQYIVGGILDVMQQMGFVVQAGSPSLEDSQSPESATIIQALRLGGGALAVSVPLEGDVWYDVDGFPRRADEGPEGQVVKSCDEAEEQINLLHAALEEQFEIRMSEPMWDGKDPNRIHKQADQLPDAHGMDNARSQGI